MARQRGWGAARSRAIRTEVESQGAARSGPRLSLKALAAIRDPAIRTEVGLLVIRTEVGLQGVAKTPTKGLEGEIPT
jgi:hypothetical protein